MVLDTDLLNQVELLRHERDLLTEKLQTATENNDLMEDLLKKWLDKGERNLFYKLRRGQESDSLVELRALVDETQAVLAVKGD